MGPRGPPNLPIFLDSSFPQDREICDRVSAGSGSATRGTANRPTMLQLYASPCRSLLANLIEAE